MEGRGGDAYGEVAKDNLGGCRSVLSESNDVERKVYHVKYCVLCIMDFVWIETCSGPVTRMSAVITKYNRNV